MLYDVRIALFALLAICPLRSGFAEPASASLETGFKTPPHSAKPHTWWHWMNGNISKEGITADLEAMQKIGLGGVQIFNAEGEGVMPPGPVRFMSEQWLGMVKHAVSEANRLGLEVCFHNCAGWSSSGGPWNTPENAMQMIVTSERSATGPSHFSEALPQPPTKLDFYRDIAVLAFKTPKNASIQAKSLSPAITASEPDYRSEAIVDRDPATAAALPLPAEGKLPFLLLGYAQPFEARSLTLVGLSECQGRLEKSADGKTFQTVREFSVPPKGMREQTFSCNFEPTSSRYYRIVFTKSISKKNKQLSLAEVELSRGLCTEDLEAKTAYTRSDAIKPIQPISYSPDDVVLREQIVDITSRLNASGKLEWDVPAGEWTILRVGYTPTGVKNHPAPKEGTGLECDKLSKKAVQAHWDGMMQKILDNLGAAKGKALNNVLIDSYEVGSQNWTPAFREEFLRLRGYDLLKFLPAFSGRIVDSPEITDRFFWDVRRTVADLFTQNYYGYFAEMAHKNGMLMSVEPYGSGLFEDLACGADADINMCEFWADSVRGFSTIKLAASVAHTNGQAVVGAESFTAQPQDGRWLKHPALLKAVGDKAYAGGVNRFIFHRYAHQPWLNVVPGMTMGRWGFHFERTNTWWDQGVAWIDYLDRCQYLLQQGQFVADVCYYTGESAPSTLPNSIKKGLPSGFDYDGCSTKVLMDMRVMDGRVVLRDGMSYAVLVLPESAQMTPQLLAKVEALISDGATIVARKPEKSPSLSNYPACDREVAKLAAAIWGDCDGKTVTEHAYGKGKVIWGKPIAEILKEKGVAPDFQTAAPQEDPSVLYIHRRTNDADIYFVSNQKPVPVEVNGVFRVEGKTPELWYPESGKCEPAVACSSKDGLTTVPLRFDPAGSVFVVFRKSNASADPVVELKRDGQPLLTLGSPSPKAAADISNPFELAINRQGTPTLTAWKSGNYEVTTASGKVSKAAVPSIAQPIDVPGPWDVQFQPKAGTPQHATFAELISWPDHPDKGIKYFSGTAKYSATFAVPADYPAKSRRLYLDLGRVEVIAEVSLNGKNLGILWKPPFRVEITDALRAGKNSLEIKVTNLWPNRLVGDEQLPEDHAWKKSSRPGEFTIAEWPKWFLDGQPSPTGRVTFTTYHHWTKEEKLLPSGLLGPVKILAAETRTFPKSR